MNKITPFNKISIGEKVYMQEVGKDVTATFEVEDVKFFENLSENEIEKIRIQYGKDICADENFWSLKKHSKYATLIYIKNAKAIAPFKVSKHDRSAFKTIGNVQKDLVLNKRIIVKHPHDCENNKHYFIFDVNTHCRFCGQEFVYREQMKQKPDYKTVKSFMKVSMWNDEWLNIDLDNIAKNRLPKISRAEINKILIKSIRSYQPNDGKQTPYYGNPIYYAQHGLGCCCRKCLEKFYAIPKDEILSNDDIEYLTDLIMSFIEEKSRIYGETHESKK